MPTRPLLRVVLAALYATAPALLISCASSSSKNRLAYVDDEIDNLSSADISADVKAAAARNDYRFLGVNSHGILVPGIDDSELNVVRNRYGIRMIENTGDMPHTQQQDRLQTVAWGYAEQYNRALRRQIPAGR